MDMSRINDLLSDLHPSMILPSGGEHGVEVTAAGRDARVNGSHRTGVVVPPEGGGPGTAQRVASVQGWRVLFFFAFSLFAAKGCNGTCTSMTKTGHTEATR